MSSSGTLIIGLLIGGLICFVVWIFIATRKKGTGESSFFGFIGSGSGGSDGGGDGGGSG